MRKISSIAVTSAFLLLVTALCTWAQQQPTTFAVSGPFEINFTQLAQAELAHPPAFVFHDAEAKENNVKPARTFEPLPADAKVTQITLPAYSANAPQVQSPTPVTSFNGLLDDGSVIPPDVNGCAGNNHLMETLNSQYRIFNKTGGTISTLSLSGFWSALPGVFFYSDPRILFDPINNRWITCIIGQPTTNSHYDFYIAVSKTDDPTGSWFEYTLDTGSSSNLPDYPSMGLNANWVVITDDFFSGGSTWNKEDIWVMNRASLYSGTLGTASHFTDATHIQVLFPALTLDVSQLTEYILSDATNSNSGGNGFVKVSSVTGTVSAPVYNTGTTIGTNHPWSNSVIGIKQKGTTTTIESDDQRFMCCIYRNGSLWGSHHVYLPATSPNHLGADVWQIDPATNTVQQFIRIEDGTGATNYSYPSMSVNANNDVVVGYTLSGTNDFASGAFSYRAGTDPANTIQSNFTYKAGLASYNKTFGSGRNRWGDYSETSVDPIDGSIWTLTQWAQTGNNWGTVWANLAPSSGTSCGIPNGLTATSITSSSATLSWNAVSGAVSYNVQYRPVGSSTWIPASSATTSVGVSGLTAGTQYEFQVQTDCGGGTTSAFSASALFTTSGTGCTDNFEPNNSKAKAAPISVNTNIVALISSSTDKDWFSFSNTASQPNIQLNLTTLPADYDLYLFNPGGTQIAASKNRGTTNEQITFNTSTVGKYSIKVIGFQGAFNATQCYTLNASISSTPFKLSSDALTSSTADSKFISIYPNPNNGSMTIEYTAMDATTAQLSVYDMMGKLVYTQSAGVVEGTNRFSINPDKLSNGLYVIEVKSNGETERSRVMVQK